MINSSLPPSLKKKESTQPTPQGLPPSLKPKSLQKKAPIDNKPVETDEDLERDVERNQAMFTSRILERLGGLPGDVYQSVPKGVKKLIPGDVLFKQLPTSQGLRKFSEEKSLGYTKPKNELEERVGEYVGDVASMSVGGGAKTVFGTTARTLGIPLVGQLAKEGIKLSGGSEKFQEIGKAGTMFLLELWRIRKGTGGGGAKKYGETLLEESEKAIPKNAMADVRVFDKSLDKLEKHFRAGITGPHTNESIRSISEIKAHIKNGQMEASKFPRIRKDINKLIDNLSGFSYEGPPIKTKKAAVGNLKLIKSALIQAGNRWGRKNSPDFFKNWREGNEALSVYHRSRDVGNFIGKNTKITNPVLKAALGVHGYHNPVKSVALHAGKKALELGTGAVVGGVYRIFKSKVLRKLYTNTLKEALRGNTANVASSVSKMEKEMEKEGIK